MSTKLSSLKSWLTIEDSAKYLSLILKEEIRETDLLQLALQGNLTLSINFINTYDAMYGKKVELSDAKPCKYPMRDGLPAGKAEILTSQEKTSFLESLKDEGLSHYLSHQFTAPYRVMSLLDAINDRLHGSNAAFNFDFFGDLLPDLSGVIEYDHKNIYPITGIWDLPMVGSERYEVEEILYRDVGGPKVQAVGEVEVVLKHPSMNQWVSLYQQYKYDYDLGDPNYRHDFHPRGRFPPGEPLVIRRDELQRFINTLSDEEAINQNYQAERQEFPPHLDALITGWQKFWKNADLSERDTWPKKADVQQWLLDRGLSQKTADAGATIITPEKSKRNK